jgi:hypothetical protein
MEAENKQWVRTNITQAYHVRMRGLVARGCLLWPSLLARFANSLKFLISISKALPLL